MASSKRGNLDSKSRKKVTQQDDDIDTSEWLDSDSDTLSSQSPSVANQYRPTGNKTEKPSGGTGQKKPTTNSFGAMTRSADDDDDEYSSIQDSDASDRVKGGMINRNSGATGQRSNDADATQTSRLRDDVGNRRAAANGGRFPEDERMNNGDDDLTYDYWSEMRPPTDDEVPLNIQDGNVAVPLPEGGLTFYGKPIFGSATDFDIWKARSDHGGGMPYRHGATDPWLSGLRRPVNYAEISRHDLKQQRERQKLQERVPWKSYTEIYAENNGQPVPGAMVTATGNPYAPCWSDGEYGRSPVNRPQGPSPDKMATCRDCHGGQYCSQAKIGRSPADGNSFRMPAQAAFLPPLNGTTTTHSVPLTFSASPGGDVQKVSIDINLKLTTPREKGDQKPSQSGVIGGPPTTARDIVQAPASSSPRRQCQSHRCSTECTKKPGCQPLSCRTAGPCGQHFETNNSQQPTQYVLADLAHPDRSWPPSHWIVPPLGLGTGEMKPVQQLQQQGQQSPKTHRHTKFGRYGEYRVFCIDDFKKMKREMKLASVFGSEKDPETLQEKKEKLAVQKGYGKLVNDRNQMELALLKSKRLQAAMLAGDERLAKGFYTRE